MSPGYTPPPMRAPPRGLPLSMGDLPVTEGFEPKNYLNAKELFVLYYISDENVTDDMRAEFIQHLKQRAFCKPGNGSSPTAHPLFQSLLATGFTWPKWMILGTLYGVDHPDLQW
jgi:hypothetical protein